MRRVSLCVCVLLAAGLASTSRAGEIRGKVYDPDDQPVAGADVWITRGTRADWKPLRTTTDAEGRYEFQGLNSGIWRLHAAKESMVQNALYIVLDRPGAFNRPDRGDLTLSAGGMLRGRVTAGETGEPITGARVVIDDGRDAETDGEGNYEIGPLSRKDHWLVVLAPGRERRPVAFDTTLRDPTRLDVAVYPGGTIYGRVLDRQGKPVEGAYVTPYEPDGAMAPLHEPTDREGRYRHDGILAGGPIQVTATAPKYRGSSRTALLPPAGEQEFEANFVIEPEPERPRLPSHEVRGRVESPEGKPVAGAKVAWAPAPDSPAANSGWGIPDASTDAEGRFIFRELPRADGRLGVSAEGFAPGEAVVPADASEVPTIRLDEGVSYRGIVRDDAGRPLAGIRVEADLSYRERRPGPLFPQRQWAARTDAEGRFRIDHMAAEGVYFRFGEFGSQIDRGSAYAFLGRDDLVPGDHENDVRLQPTGALRGRVVDEAGKPIERFRIVFRGPSMPPPAEPERARVLRPLWRTDGVHFTAEDGRFLLGGIDTAGKLVDIVVLADGYQYVEASGVALGRLVGEESEGPTFVLKPARSMRIKVMQATDGRPVKRAWVTVNPGPPNVDGAFNWSRDQHEGIASWVTMTSDEGETGPFTIAAETATVAVWAHGYGCRRVAWRGGKELRIELDAGAQITSRVVDPAGNPPPLNWVLLRSAADDQFWLRTAPSHNDAFLFRNLAPGTYRLYLDPRSAADGTLGKPVATVNLTAGETKELPPIVVVPPEQQ